MRTNNFLDSNPDDEEEANAPTCKTCGDFVEVETDGDYDEDGNFGWGATHTWCPTCSKPAICDYCHELMTTDKPAVCSDPHCEKPESWTSQILNNHIKTNALPQKIPGLFRFKSVVIVRETIPHQ